MVVSWDHRKEVDRACQVVCSPFDMAMHLPKASRTPVSRTLTCAHTDAENSGEADNSAGNVSIQDLSGRRSHTLTQPANSLVENGTWIQSSLADTDYVHIPSWISACKIILWMRPLLDHQRFGITPSFVKVILPLSFCYTTGLRHRLAEKWLAKTRVKSGFVFPILYFLHTPPCNVVRCNAGYL